MDNKIWLTNGKWVSNEQICNLIVNDPEQAAGIVLQVKDENIKNYLTKCVLIIVDAKRGRSSSRKQKESTMAEDLFHDFTFGFFED